MGELIKGFEDKRLEQLNKERNTYMASRAFLLAQLEHWAEQETIQYRAYSYSKEKREETARKLEMFVVPDRTPDELE